MGDILGVASFVGGGEGVIVHFLLYKYNLLNYLLKFIINCHDI